jgi:beta-glucosidase
MPAMTDSHGNARFPDGFWWGTGASSTQTEGAAPRSDWARWESLGKVPRSGDGNGFGTRYAEDFALYAEHNLTHHRLSIEWARIEPDEGARDGEAIEHYRRVLEAARDAGINVWVCLHHFTLPGWFGDDRGGFLDEKASGYYWPRHVDFVAETFGDLVYGWKPINEPGWYALGGFLSGTLPPGRRDVDDYRTARRSIHGANHTAARLLRGNGQPVATVHGLAPLHTTDSSPEAQAALRRLDDSVWGSWLELLRDSAHADDFDVIGFSYYSAAGVGPDGGWGTWPPGQAPGPMGYVPWPDGLGEVLHRLAEELPDRPLLVSECGLGTPDARRDDEDRIEYLRACTDVVAEAISDGIDVRGFFFWTGVDNYEWGHGDTVSFGLFDRDRNPKESAAFASEVANVS